MVNLKINNIDVQAPEGSTILEAARSVNIKIPTLCHLELHGLGYLNQEANCRICLVEDKRGNLIPSCNTLVKEGMVIKTNTLKVIHSRRTNLELILSNHPKACLTCSSNGQCELQKLAADANLNVVRFGGRKEALPIDASSHAIVRDPNKCILCKRCETMCYGFQTVGTLTDVGRGFSTVVGTQYMLPINQTNCTFCGQCLAVCPTGALAEQNNIEDVYKALRDPNKTVVVQTAPAVRVALGETFGMEPGNVVTGKMVTALKEMGFDYVFDTNFAADLTTMEEATEFVNRFKKNENLPQLTSCCPSWIKFIEHNFPEMLNMPSSCKSPHEMFGSIAKSYFAERMGIDPKNMVVVSVMPCVAKKYESNRPELAQAGGVSDVDIVVTTRELAFMIKDFAIDFENLEDTEFDNPLGESSGAGAIYGASGGVLESVLRTAYYMITGDELEDIEFTQLRGMETIKEAEIDIQGRQVKVATASGLGNARKLLNSIRNKEKHYDVIEIMGCPGGCINGGGQPYIHGDTEKLQTRMEAIHSIDKNKKIRKAHQNPEIKEIYDSYLGEPCGELAEKLLHTEFTKRKKY